MKYYTNCNTRVSVGFRTWGYAKTLYPSVWEHLKSYCFGKWNDNVLGIWIDKGFRVFGVEFNHRKYLTN